MAIKVSLVFDNADLTIGRKVYDGLTERNVDVYSNSPDLIEKRHGWGKTYHELIEFLYSEEINFCIVLLSPQLIRKLRQRNHHSFYLLEAALRRNNFILPIQLENELDSIPTYLKRFYAPIISKTESQEIIELFFDKIADYQDALGDIKDYKDTLSVLRSYNKQLQPENISGGKIKLRDRQIGFELFQVADDFAPEHNKYFLSLFSGTTIKNTAQYVREHFPEAFKSKALVILLPKERGQKVLAKRKSNIADAFVCQNVFYFDEFLWTYCTKNEFLKIVEKFQVPQFIDPFFQGQHKKALDYLDAWWTMPHEPVLVVKGGGGFGKTTLVKQFSNTLIGRPNITILYFDSSEVTRSIRKGIDWYDRLDIYTIYKAFCNLRGEGSVEEEVFKLNIDNGNITIVIDGIDEIISRLPSIFDLNAFIRSIYECTSKVGDGKVILTCRNYFWDQTSPDFQFDTVELLPFDRPLAKEYFSRQFHEFPSLSKRAMTMADSLNRREDRRGEDCDCYIPFVLDIISNLLKDEINDDESGDPEFCSKFFNSEITNDYILFKFCNREIVKLGANISIDDQVRVFINFAVQHGSSIRQEKAKEFGAVRLAFSQF